MDNQIKVLPVSPNDDRIWQATYHKIFGRDVLWQYQFRAVPPIHIVVKNRDVKVEGVVALQTDKQIAGMQANRRLRRVLSGEQFASGKRLDRMVPQEVGYTEAA